MLSSLAILSLAPSVSLALLLRTLSGKSDFVSVTI